MITVVWVVGGNSYRHSLGEEWLMSSLALISLFSMKYRKCVQKQALEPKDNITLNLEVSYK